MTISASDGTLEGMKTFTINKIWSWLLRFIQIQLFISTISLPILLCWGLPISIVSPLGNLLFFPVLIVFLILSSIIFFLEIVHIPNSLIIFCLDKLTTTWLSVMSWGSSKRWLVGFSKPSLLFLVAVPLIAFAIMQNKKTNSIGRSIVLLTLLLTCSFSYLKLINTPATVIQQIECNGGAVTLVRSNGTTVVIDPGVIGKRVTSSSWVAYTLAPTIIKNAGSNSIDHLIVLQPGIATFNAIEKLCTVMRVDTLYLPWWEGTLNKSGWRAFFHMQRAAEQQGTKIVRIGKYKRHIKLSPNNHVLDHLLIEPLPQKISYHQAHYDALCATGHVDKQTFTIYSAKYKKNAPKMNTQVKSR